MANSILKYIRMPSSDLLLKMFKSIYKKIAIKCTKLNNLILKNTDDFYERVYYLKFY